MKMPPSRYLLCLLLWLWPLCATSTGKSGGGVDIEDAEFLLLELEVQRLLVFDFEGYLYQEQLYLPATQLLSILKLPYTYQETRSILEVSLPSAGQKVYINFEELYVRGTEEPVTLTDSDFMIDAQDIYLRREWIEKVFGYSLSFDYRSLKLMLFTSEELPVVQDYNRRQLYKVFEKDTRVVYPDIQQPAGRHLLNGWVANWSLSSSHNPLHQDYAYGLGLGGHLLGGDLSVSTNGSRQYGFRWDQTRGQWQFPFHNSPVIQQVTIGDQSQPDALGGSHMSYRGITVSNRPVVPRRIFDTFRLSPFLEDGWDAEFHVNNRLTDVVMGSQQDSLSFSTPLKYGTNRLTLRYYDPDGVEYGQEYLIQIPYEFLPPGKLEYDVSAGTYRNFEAQQFVNGQLKWGASSRITLGGGFRYTPEQGVQNSVIPYMQTWIRPDDRLIIEGSHAHTYFSSGALRYTFPNSRPLRLSFEKYHQSSVYNKLNKSLEAAANTSFPLKLSTFRASVFTSGTYTRYQSGSYMNLYGGISSSLPSGIQARINSRLSFRSTGQSVLQKVRHSTDVQLSRRLFRQYLFRPTIEFDHGLNRVIQSQLEVSRRVLANGYLSLAVQHNHQAQQSSLYLRFSLNLPYARHSSYVSTTQNRPTFSQSSSGTVALDRHRNVYIDQRNWIGKAAARITPFLDYDDDGQWDKDEPFVEGLRADFYEAENTHFPVRRNEQTAHSLTPHATYLVQINSSSLDNPLWMPKYNNIQIRVNPNMVNNIYVPILVSGEIAGNVRMKNSSQQHRMSGLKVHLRDTDGMPLDTLRTYTGGAFFHVGLKPGRYSASLDQSQLDELSLYAVTDSVEFIIRSTRDGDIVEGIELEIASQQAHDLNEVYSIQVGAFRIQSNARHMQELSRQQTQLSAHITYHAESSLYKCRVGSFNQPQDAWDKLRALQRIYPDLFRYAFVTSMKVEPPTY